jgi:hypothetical protein
MEYKNKKYHVSAKKNIIEKSYNGKGQLIYRFKNWKIKSTCQKKSEKQP